MEIFNLKDFHKIASLNNCRIYQINIFLFDYIKFFFISPLSVVIQELNYAFFTKYLSGQNGNYFYSFPVQNLRK
jgi:hypothetical protein